MTEYTVSLRGPVTAPEGWTVYYTTCLLYTSPAGILIALVYLGMCYQLWYIPAFLLGLFLVNQLVKRLGMVWTGVDVYKRQPVLHEMSGLV